MSVATIASAALLGMSAAYHAATLGCALRWWRDGVRAGAENDTGQTLPGVTIFKPLCGIDAGHEQNLRSFCELDYPDYQVIFAALDPNDPALETAYLLQREYPDLEIIVIAGGELRGENRKVSTLLAIEPHARNEILVFADSDMRVVPHYLRRVVEPFDDPATGLVTCPYRCSAPTGMAGKLEALGVGAEFIPGTFLAYHGFGIRFAFGSTIAIRKSVLDGIGGLKSIVDVLADDFTLADRTHRAGHRVVLSHYVVDNILGPEPTMSVLRRRLRWARTSRAMRPGPYYGVFITYFIPFALLYAAAGGFTPASWGLFASAVALRLAIAAMIALRTGDRAVLRLLPLLPLSEFVSAGIWVVSLLGRRVHWRGEWFRIAPDGSLARQWP